MDNSYQHPPIIITIQGLSVWEGVRSPGSPEQTLWDAPPSRRAAHVRAHPYTPRQQQREQPPRARTHFQATSKTLTTLGRSHVRSHPARLWGSHTPSLSCAQHYWLADTAPWRHRDHSPKREPGRKGDWGSRDEETTAPDSAPALMDAAE